MKEDRSAWNKDRRQGVGVLLIRAYRWCLTAYWAQQSGDHTLRRVGGFDAEAIFSTLEAAENPRSSRFAKTRPSGSRASSRTWLFQ